MSTKPVFSRRLGRIEVAVWRNETPDSIWHNVTFQRSYRDEAGALQSTQNFRADDMASITFLSSKAFDFLCSYDEA
ncbi:hypothetical protein [Rhodopirellula europaea]|uniref:hypothetical protein n=1 Tax=Rhodopirellula europaea TaxID=1263866 RepID=UPI0030EB18B6